MKLVVIHGPNLNLLGTREPEVYGTQTLEEINAEIAAHAGKRGATVETFQSNHEGEIIDRIQQAARDGVAAIVMNPGAYSHTSIAIEDALRSISIPCIEVHLSNIHARRGRARSVTARASKGIISGFGATGYCLAVDAAVGVVGGK